MKAPSARLALLFSCLGHAYMHLFTAFYFVIALSLEATWGIPNHELIKLWALGSLLVGLAALPAGWLGDRWSASGMMTVFFIGLGISGIVCGLVNSTFALMLGLAAVGLFSAIYHPVGIAWLVKSARARGMALAVNGIFGSLGVASAGLVAGVLIDAVSWRAAFIVPGVVCLVTGLALLLALRLGWVRETDSDQVAEPAPSRGVRVTAEEEADLLHLWRYTGYFMGVRDELLCATIPEAARLAADHQRCVRRALRVRE